MAQSGHMEANRQMFAFGAKRTYADGPINKNRIFEKLVEGLETQLNYGLRFLASQTEARLPPEPIIFGKLIGALLDLLARLNAQKLRQAVFTIRIARILTQETFDLS
jgi:hypothetical protein